MPGRPLSPHLQVYKFGYTMVTSILNRFTGLGLSLGLVLLVYWLVAVAAGPHAHARAQRLLGLPLLKVVYAALIISYCYHLVAGIRHLLWDTGRFLERGQARRGAWVVAAVSVILMLVVGLGAWLAGSRGP
jgi:succinate dehydrogenase / fumarate reductase, cytochrome b subunit